MTDWRRTSRRRSLPAYAAASGSCLAQANLIPPRRSPRDRNRPSNSVGRAGKARRLVRIAATVVARVRRVDAQRTRSTVAPVPGRAWPRSTSPERVRRTQRSSGVSRSTCRRRAAGAVVDAGCDVEAHERLGVRRAADVAACCCSTGRSLTLSAESLPPCQRISLPPLSMNGRMSVLVASFSAASANSAFWFASQAVGQRVRRRVAREVVLHRRVLEQELQRAARAVAGHPGRPGAGVVLVAGQRPAGVGVGAAGPVRPACVHDVDRRELRVRQAGVAGVGAAGAAQASPD